MGTAIIRNKCEKSDIILFGVHILIDSFFDYDFYLGGPAPQRSAVGDSASLSSVACGISMSTNKYSGIHTSSNQFPDHHSPGIHSPAAWPVQRHISPWSEKHASDRRA